MTVGYSSNIVAELVPLAAPIGQATRHPDNVRTHNINAIARSLQEHGQRTPIVVQKSTGFIVKGNGTHEAAELLGWDELAMSWQDMDDDRALSYLLADNKASDLAKYDRNKTVAALTKLLNGSGLQATLWDEDELEDMVGPTTRTVGEFTGDYVDDAAARQEEMRSSPTRGTKMKETPLVLPVEQHEVFMGQVDTLQRLFGTTGKIATIVEAVRRQAEGVPNEQSNLGDLETIRQQVLRESRDYFLADGRPNWSTGAIAAYFQSQMASQPAVTDEHPEPAAVAPGQMSLDDLL